MDLDLNEDQRILRDNIVRFAENELNQGVAERDKAHGFGLDQWRKCGELNLQGLPVPQELGGAGLDALSTAVALEALGYGCADGGLVFSICAHLLACVVPIWKHGSADQHARYLRKLCDGSLIAVNAMTEPGTGSDAFAMKTRAVPDGAGFRITGTKIFGSNGPIADLAVVYALTDPAKGFHGGVTCFLVEKGTPGFAPGQRFEKLGLRTSPIGELVFDEVYVGPEQIVGKVGGAAPIFAQSMDWERALLGASHLGTMQRVLDKALEYARTRRQYNQPIGKYQGVSHKIADMKVRLEAARGLAHKAAWKLERARDAGMYASIAKLYVSEALQQAALDLVQIFGGYGFTTEYDAERILRDSIGSTIYSGTSEIQRNIIARWLGL
ncbi:MAG: acyl-CoA dehydrogenase family protein [Gammaproteobacteria bacterium]